MLLVWWYYDKNIRSRHFVRVYNIFDTSKKFLLNQSSVIFRECKLEYIVFSLKTMLSFFVQFSYLVLERHVEYNCCKILEIVSLAMYFVLIIAAIYEFRKSNKYIYILLTGTVKYTQLIGVKDFSEIFIIGVISIYVYFFLWFIGF